MDDNTGYLRTNERDELVSHCEFVASYSRLPDKGINEWRWLIIGSVLALQGACVCTLTWPDTRNVAMLRKDDRKAWAQWYNSDRTSPAPTSKRLADPMELLKRVRRACGCGKDYSFNISDDGVKACKRLIELRRDFAHFLPMGWSIERAGLPQLMGHCWNIMRQLVVLQPSFAHQLEGHQRQSLKFAVDEVLESMAIAENNS